MKDGSCEKLFGTSLFKKAVREASQRATHPRAADLGRGHADASFAHVSLNRCRPPPPQQLDGKGVDTKHG